MAFWCQKWLRHTALQSELVWIMRVLHSLPCSRTRTRRRLREQQSRLALPFQSNEQRAFLVMRLDRTRTYLPVPAAQQVSSLTAVTPAET
jgi:hypothetical protein